MTIQRAEADLASAQADVARLEGDLARAKARIAKLQGFLEMAREYGVASTAAPPVPLVSAAVTPPVAPVVAVVAGQRNARVVAAERRAAIVRAVLPVLRQEVWTPADQLVRPVQAAGIVLGRYAAKKVSAVLAREPTIQSGVGKGYRLMPQR